MQKINLGFIKQTRILSLRGNSQKIARQISFDLTISRQYECKKQLLLSDEGNQAEK